MPDEQKTVEQGDKTQAADETLILDDLFPDDKKTVETATTTTTTTEKPAQQDDAAKEAALLAKVSTMVQEQVNKSIQGTDKKITRQQQITSYLTSDKGKLYAQYTDDIAKVALDPRFLDISLDRVIGMALTPEKILKIGTKLAKEADEESRKSETGGSSGGAGSLAATTDVWGMPDKEFEELQLKAMSGGFKKK